MRKPKLQQLDDFTRAYIEALAWTEQPEAQRRPGEFYLDPHYYSRIHGGVITRAVKDCAAFQAANATLLAESGLADSSAGHDYWLSRNGYGSGYFDRGLDDIGDKLQKAAHACGQHEVYWSKGRLYSV